MSKKPTITDVAKHACGKDFDSYAMNGRPGVSATTVGRVLAATDELGWRPNPNTRSLTTSSAYALELVILREPGIIGAHPFIPAFITGVELIADNGRVIVLSVVPDEDTEHALNQKLVDESRVDGARVTDHRYWGQVISLLDELGIPAVIRGLPDVPRRFPTIERDYSEGIAGAVRHLHQLGHTGIATVTGDYGMLSGIAAATRSATRPRLSGSTRHRRGGLLPNRWRASGARTTGPDRPTDRERPRERPDGQCGHGCRPGLGYQLPRDISVTSMDGSEISQYAYPALITGGNGCYLASTKWAMQRTLHSRPRSSSCAVR